MPSCQFFRAVLRAISGNIEGIVKLQYVQKKVANLAPSLESDDDSVEVCQILLGEGRKHISCQLGCYTFDA